MAPLRARACARAKAPSEAVLDGSKALGRFSMLEPGDRVAVAVRWQDSWFWFTPGRTRGGRRFRTSSSPSRIEQGKFKSSIRALGPRCASSASWVRRDIPARGARRGRRRPRRDVCSPHRRRALYASSPSSGARRWRSVTPTTTAPSRCSEHPLQRPDRVAAPLPARARAVSAHPPPRASDRRSDERLRAGDGLPTVGCVCGDRDSVRRADSRLLLALRESTRCAGVDRRRAGNVTRTRCSNGT